MASAGRPYRVLIIIENLTAPFDRRVWQEATALREAGYVVSIICPTGSGYESKHEILEGINIYRYKIPFEARKASGFLIEYSVALFWQFVLAFRVLFGPGFDVIQACNPPDNIFLVGAFFKFLLGKKFIFDHHDLCPELYLAKFERRDFLYWTQLACERLTFWVADLSIATNESYRKVACERGKMPPDRVFVVRSGPSLERMRIVPPKDSLRNGRKYLVGYVGVIGKQEGIDYLLRAVREIVRTLGRDDIHFGIVGGGPDLERMKEYSGEIGVSEFVTFFGRVPDQEMLEVLNTADVCVNPDVANEMNDKSTMNKIMEYMALGKPIVQFDLTEGKVSAQAASLYAEPNNEADLARKIVALLDDPEARARMGAFGRDRVTSALEWRFEVPKLLAAYESVKG